MDKPETPKNAPTVSIIIPAYNAAYYLPRALKSVFDQTYQNYEVIVIDDGSTDNVCEVISLYQDPKLRFIRQANRGLAGARNTGLAAARGEYIAFLDADDVFLPIKLEQQVQYLNDHPDCGLVSGGWNVINEKDEILATIKPWQNKSQFQLVDLLYSIPMIVHSVLIKKSWIEKVGGFDSNLRRVEDWDLWLRLAYAGCQMGWVYEIVCAYRMSSGQMTRDAAEQKRVSIHILEKFFNQSNVPDDILALESRIYANCYVSCAAREFGVNQIDEAKSSINKAIELDPDLINKNVNVLLDKLLSWTGDPFVGDPIQYTRRVFDNLPPKADKLRTKKRWALGEIGLRSLFKAYQLRDWDNIRQAGLIVVLNAPHRLVSRGIVSILLQSIIHSFNS